MPLEMISLFVVCMVVFSLVLLAFILWFSSLLGWKSWSRAFPGELPDGARPLFRFCTGGFAWWACYNNCLRVIPIPGGLLVRPIPPFTWFHPWIFLPFAKLAEPWRIGGFPKRCRLVFAGPRNLRFTLHLPQRACTILEKAVPAGK